MISSKKILIPIILCLFIFATAAPLAVALSPANNQQPLLFAMSLQLQASPQPISKQYINFTWDNRTIDSSESYQNYNITINGDLTINSTGELRLRHCILNVNNGTSSVEYGINVTTGGKLYINESTTITAINPAKPYYFTVYEGAVFQMNDSRVEYCGDNSGSWPDKRGFTLRANNAWIENNIITHCNYGLFLFYSNGSTILNNTATNNYNRTFLLWYSNDNILMNNNVTDSTGYGFNLEWSLNNSLTGNTATNIAEGFYLSWSDDNNITGNTATNNAEGFYLRYSYRNNFTGNTALNCTTGYNLVYSYFNDFTGSVEANYLQVNVTNTLNNPISGADVKVENETVVYATPYFAGSDPQTNSNGVTPWIAVPYKTFTTKDTMTENITIVTVWYHDVLIVNNSRTVNMSMSHMETFQMQPDETPPETMISPSGNLGLNDWYLSDVAINMVATDYNSGVNKTEYSLNGTTWLTYTGPFPIIVEGTTTIQYNSTDNAGNVETTKSTTVKIDKTPPITTPSLSGTLGQGGWYKTDVTINLSATDTVSGVNKTAYSINGTAWNLYTAPFIITAEGNTTVYYNSTDNAGNVETTKSTTVKIDKTPPVTTPNLSGTLGQGGWYKTDVTINLSATDTVSGVNKTAYNINGSAWISYSVPFPITAEGTTTIQYNSTDNAGNVEGTNSTIIKIDRTPPDITITSPSDGAVLPTDDIQVTWTGSDAKSDIAYYNISIDGGAWINVGTNTNYMFNDLSENSHTVDVKGVDLAGNEAIESVTFTVDTTPPTITITAPSNGAILPYDDVNVIWTGSDNIALNHYEIRIDGGSWENMGTSESQVFNNLDNGPHTVDVMAFDGALNTNTSTVSFTVDTEEPDVTITSPADDALLTSGDVTVYWTSVATDIVYYNISVDGDNWINVGLATNHLFPGLFDGPHNVEVMAVDEAGLNGTDSVTFTVDTTPPTITITAPIDGAFLSSGDPTVTWTGSDATSGIDHFEIRIDGGSWENMGTSKSKPYSGLSEGPHTVEVVAYDKAGLTDTDSVSFTVDTSSPTVTITNPVDGAFSPVDNVEVMWTGSDAITSIDYYEIRIDGGSWENMGTSKSKPYSGLSEGPHTVEVRAFDQAGNNNTDTVSFTVDTTPPTVSITSPIPDEEFNTSTVTVNWTADDTNFDCCMYRLDSGSWHNVGSETSHIFTGLSNGPHTVEIMAVDQAGHSSTDTVSFIVNVPVSPSVILVLVSLSLMQLQGVPMVYLMVGGAAVGAVTAVGLVLWLRRRP